MSALAGAEARTLGFGRSAALFAATSLNLDGIQTAGAVRAMILAGIHVAANALIFHNMRLLISNKFGFPRC